MTAQSAALAPSAINVGIVAGEASGDNLGAGLMDALSERYPGCAFIGVGGSRMVDRGLVSLASMDRLAVNGIVDPIKRLPMLLRTLRMLCRELHEARIQVFVGIDFNVFNLLLERRLKRRGIATVHYVSPSVYAWRRGRVRRIARAADTLLTLYPFEPAFYADVDVQAVFVGHPLADEIGLQAGSQPARAAARATLGLSGARPCIALLPGSRMSEVRLLSDTFLDAARIIARRCVDASFVVPCVNPAVRAYIDQRVGELRVVTYEGDARQALTACDGALIKSGTGTLEAMLLRRPMVVCYKLGPVSHAIIRPLVRTPWIALPNILAGEQLVPELLQDAATPEALAEKMLEQLDKARRDPEYLERFAALHRELGIGANARAAIAVARWIDDG